MHHANAVAQVFRTQFQRPKTHTTFPKGVPRGMFLPIVYRTITEESANSAMGRRASGQISNL